MVCLCPIFSSVDYLHNHVSCLGEMSAKHDHSQAKLQLTGAFQTVLANDTFQTTKAFRLDS